MASVVTQLRSNNSCFLCVPCFVILFRKYQERFSKCLRKFQCTLPTELTSSLSMIMRYKVPMILDHPFEKWIWVLSLTISKCKPFRFLLRFMYQILPALMIDWFLLIYSFEDHYACWTSHHHFVYNKFTNEIGNISAKSKTFSSNLWMTFGCNHKLSILNIFGKATSCQKNYFK